MAEQAPEMRPTPKDERDKAAKLKAQYEEAQFLADQLEAFGAFDTTVPNEGEVNYQQYLDQRPADGVVRDGEGYRDTQSGQFASEATYEAQNGTTQDYYDQKGGMVNTAEYQPPNYEEMGVLQLAKEAAKARQLGDRATEEEVRAAVEHYLTADAMKDDSESPEEAQARFESELNRYDQLVDRFLGRGAAQHAGESHSPKPGEGDTSERTAANETDAESEATTVQPVDTLEDIELGNPTPVDTLDDLTLVDATEAESEKVEPGGYYNGKKVSVTNVVPHPSGDTSKDTLTVQDEDGNITTIHADEIEYKGGASKDTSSEQLPGKELELVPTEQETAKKWWQKVGSFIRERAGVAYWAGQFEGAKHGAKEWFLNRGVEDSMNEDEKEERRRHNRHVNMVGGIALGIAGGFLAGFAIANGLPSGGSGDAARHVGEGLSGAGTPGGSHEVGGQQLQDLMNSANPGGVETAPADIITAAPGQGGESLFNGLGIDASKWYDNARAMLHDFPQDFYLEGNDVRIAHTGPLSQGAQNFINSLR